MQMTEQQFDVFTTYIESVITKAIMHEMGEDTKHIEEYSNKLKNSCKKLLVENYNG